MPDVYYVISIHEPFTTTWSRGKRETNLRESFLLWTQAVNRPSVGGHWWRNMPLFHYQTGLPCTWHIYFVVIVQFHPAVCLIASPWYIPYHGLVTIQPLLSENIAHGNRRSKALSGTTTVMLQCRDPDDINPRTLFVEVMSVGQVSDVKTMCKIWLTFGLLISLTNRKLSPYVMGLVPDT